ncbi:hypothetical protein KW787_03775 [Candidatus Pacearchaeota archaeon]|nr:hypothetical protein [Candidatus Pacearchaeota archaeon]
MDPIKEAFAKAKQDIHELRIQMEIITQSLEDIKRTLYQQITNEKPTNQQISPTIKANPTDNLPLEGVKTSYMDTSTGNEGVPTDRQTDRQTDQHIPPNTKILYKVDTNTPKNEPIDHLEKVSQVLESLDAIKKELRVKFKRLTQQEMLIFSTIYQLEEEHFAVDYPQMASKLGLSESSIRDYVQKIIKKGIPIIKTKENNKKIILSLLPDFKRLASLETILSLREL